MEFEWDQRKAETNQSKHRVDFADAVMVLSDEHALTILDDHGDEDRFVTLGRDSLGRLLVVVYCWRDVNIRLISARKATPRERHRYEEKNET